MQLVLILTIIAIALAYDFKDYIREFSKSYPDPAQYMIREAAFNKAYQQILLRNSQNNACKLAVNKFTDWTDNQTSALNTVNINTSLVASSTVTPSLRNIPSTSAPQSFDWRTTGKVTSVKDQGACGDCWAFSSTAMYQSFLLISTNTSYDLSQEYVLECTGKNDTCSGGYVDDALNLQIKGVPTLTNYPYLGAANTNPSTPGICSATNLIKPPYTLTWQYFNNITNANLQEKLLSSPMVALFYAENQFMSYSSGIYSCSKVATSSDINHAILIIGYTSDGNYIIKNSYGTSWGQSGYAIINASMDCGLKLYTFQFVAASFGLSLLLPVMLILLLFV